MVDFTFDIEIHVGECFVEDPTLQYVDGSIHTLTEIDPDKLSFFEIQDLYHLVGAPKEHNRYRYLLPEGDLEDDLRDIKTDPDVVNMTTLHKAWLANKIIIYTDIDVEPLAVEHPDERGVADDGVGGCDEGVDEIDLESDYDEVVLEEEEDVENVEDGAKVEEQDIEVGLEGEGFGDDIFAAPNSTPQGFALESSDAPNTAQASGNAPNTATESSNVPHVAPETSGMASLDGGDGTEWAEPTLEDNLVSMDGSNDEQVPEQPEFNAKSDMRNVVLKKEMKFPNAKVFRTALREYAIKKPVDIKFKLNERTKISVHCKNESKQHQLMLLRGSLKILAKIQIGRSKRKAKDLINGDEQLQYDVLRDYAQMINTVDKGSRVILQTKMANETSQPKFKRMYVRFNAIGILGGCKPFIGLDGCHIKHRFGGQILSAIAKDANDNIFPVVMAVVEQENKESWIWFLEIFADDIGRPEEFQLVFISDR
ncbi:uncharacterized protein LOC115950449 [Quercus lobata]|uniref:uncharacterized protein LOC115950449 n=1 Tax=Quercus lobata TaxID=97700 RepID=UPI001246136A|nr:uncharacterized protein LOC115950449 [Quercus lobata]